MRSLTPRLAPWLLAALVGCSPSSPPPASATTLARAEESPLLRASPGFVVYGDEGTLVVPIHDPARAVAGDGFWLIEEQGGGVTQWSTDAPTEELTCAPGVRSECVAGDWLGRRFDREGALVDVATADARQHCACVEAEPSEDDEADEEEDPCAGVEGTDPTWVSLVGGSLFALGGVWDNEGCSGARVVDSRGAVRALVEGARGPDARVRGACHPALLASPGWPTEAIGVEPCPPSSDDDACASCGEQWGDEATALYLGRGQLARVGTNAAATWELTYVRTEPLGAANCPGPADPCGDPRSFPGIEGYEEWWIASDGSAALVARDGQAGVLLAGARAPVRFDALPATLLGVRFHADVQPLLDRLADEPAASSEGAEGVRPSPEGRAPEVGAPPASRPGLAPADRDFVDRRGGRDWGNRCYGHLQANELDAAEACCDRGLAMATDPSVEGAILYNLGRIAEARGRPELAIERYERSLAVRPGNAIVQARLNALR